MADDRRVPTFLRAVTWLECGVVFSAAALLLLAPRRGGQDLWAWLTPPFNARYIGAIYLAALVPLVIFAVSGRWMPGRMVLWMIFAFTASIAVVMLGYPGRFEWQRFATWVFWALYLFLPINSAVHLWRYRKLPIDWRVRARPATRLLVTVAAVALGGYGIALLAVPETTTDFWPWPVDAFHGRIYAATFLAPAVGAWVVRHAGAPAEYATLGVTLITYGVASAIAVVVTSTEVPAAARVDYGAAGTWAFLAIGTLMLAGGIYLLGGYVAAQAAATSEATAGVR